MSFHEIDFPLSLAFGAKGGPVRKTEIVTLANGREQRNARQKNSRRKYDAGIGVRSLDDLHILIKFFEARHGQLYGFRFRDPFDHESGEDGEVIGTGDGVNKTFQLVKHYSDSEFGWVRKITKPVEGSVRIAVSGQEIIGINTDITTGLVTLDTAPLQDEIVKAWFEFNVPVRFDSEQISATLEGFGAGKTISVPLVEILPNA